MFKVNKNKKLIIAVIAAVSVICVIIGSVIVVNVIQKNRAIEAYCNAVDSYNNAIGNYNAEVAEYNKLVNTINDNNKSFIKVINEAQTVIERSGNPYDDKYLVTARTQLIKLADKDIKKIDETNIKATIDYEPEIKKHKKEEIVNLTERINEDITVVENDQVILSGKKSELILEDYSKDIADVEKAKVDLIHSCSIQRQITDPSQEYVINRLDSVKNIANIAPSTLENDPNDGMSSENGYKVQIYFSTPLLSTENLEGDKLIKAGSSAGGSIEIFRTVEEAKSRDKYLSAVEWFPGKSGGYHFVMGSMVVRLSNKLSYNDRNELQDSVIKALTEPDLSSYDIYLESKPAALLESSTNLRMLDIKLSIPDEFDNISTNFGNTNALFYTGELRRDDGNDLAFIFSSTFENTIGLSMTYYNNSYFRKSIIDTFTKSYLKKCKDKKNFTLPFANVKAIAQSGSAQYRGMSVYYLIAFAYFPDINEYNVSIMVYKYGYKQKYIFPDLFKEMLSTATTNAMANRSDDNNNIDIIGTVSEDFKQQMDDYKVFYNKYVEFMNKFKASNDSLSLYGEYVDMFKQYVRKTSEIESIDVKALPKADYNYFVKVRNNINDVIFETSN